MTEKIAKLANDVLTMTLHGPLPLETPAKLAEGVLQLQTRVTELEGENEELNTAMTKTCEDLMGGVESVTCSRCTLTREYKHVFLLRHDGDEREYMCHSCARKSIRGYQLVVRQCTEHAEAAEAKVQELEKGVGEAIAAKDGACLAVKRAWVEREEERLFHIARSEYAEKDRDEIRIKLESAEAKVKELEEENRRVKAWCEREKEETVIDHRRIAKLEEELRRPRLIGEGKDIAWRWQGDSEDHLESMCDDMVVLITAGGIRDLISTKGGE